MFKVEITRSGLAAIGKNGYREAGRHAVERAAWYWFRNFLKLHFENIAYVRYHYAHRDKRTDKYKQLRKPWPFGEHTAPAKGEVKPLVFTGRSRELAFRPNISAKAKDYQTYRAVVVIDAPAFNFGVGKRIDMRDEVTRFSAQEEKTMENIFAREWRRRLEQLGVLRRRKTYTRATKAA